MALVHGNEVAGVAVLNKLLEWIQHNIIDLPFPVAFALGNPEAALMGQRFLETDMNRSFGAGRTDSLEKMRAAALAPLLQDTHYFLDLHQTIEPSLTPFLIGRYNPETYHFARLISPDLPLVTHWGSSFSTEGSTSDEYVISKGGTGMTIELGRAGFHPVQIAMGLTACLNAIHGVSQLVQQAAPPSRASELGPLYTWGETIKGSTDEPVNLDKGWQNFMPVHKGQRLGTQQGRELAAAIDGYILFPKYVTGTATRPAEMCRIIRQISEQDLGKDL
jgi:succinylglutamate desuccinylase